MPALNGLSIYAVPVAGRAYVIGADPAEGNPSSDESAATILDVDTGREVAALCGKFEPSTFSGHIARLSQWYNNAAAMVERNNHGHAVLLWLRDHAPRLLLLHGDEGNKAGWNTTTKSKSTLYATAGEAFRDQETIIHSLQSFAELASIEGSTLRAPAGMRDDRAMAFCLALAGRARWLKLYPRGLSLSQGPIALTPAPANVYGSGLESGGWDHGRSPGGGALGYGAEAGYLQGPGRFIAPGLDLDALRWPRGWTRKEN
jgi:hypothetical protein